MRSTAASSPPLAQCSTNAGQATVATGPLTSASSVILSSEDNRAVWHLDPSGALVTLAVALGEPGSVSAIGNSNIQLNPSGIPACTAELQAQVVSCDGLVPGARYALTRARGHAVGQARASGGGVATFAGMPGAVPVARGDRFTLRNATDAR